jgi:SAM-dependent methyltransferase
LLAGEAHALELLVPGGDTSLLEALYGELPESRVVIAAVAAAVAELRALAPPGRALRVLELGGGVGATTRAVASALAPADRYCFTDISAAFLDDARRRFGHRPGFGVARWDIDAPPPGPVFDAIIATNVLHCARSLPRTLAMIRASLTDCGLLLTAEATRAERWHAVTLALLPGYFAAEDNRRGEGTPLLSAAGWSRALADAGFAAPAVIPSDAEAGTRLCQHVVVARR